MGWMFVLAPCATTSVSMVATAAIVYRLLGSKYPKTWW